MMTDISAFLPEESRTVTAIYAHYKKVGDSEAPRGYLGASIIGHSCDRYLWYAFRFCFRSKFSGRMYRLLKRGDLEEIRIVKDLRAIGCEVHEVDPTTRKQFEVAALAGHVSGHMDSALRGIPEAPKTWHVGEFKTHNAKSYAKLKADGVKKAKPMHHAQMQTYMHLTGMTRALYVACNKDTDELYTERVYYDKDFAESLIARAERIIKATAPPERISDRQDWWECSYCDAKTICWPDPDGPALPIPEINCRQCCHATPTMDGNARWQCDKHCRGLSPSDQQRACQDHLCLPGLLSFTSPMDYGSEDGREWILFSHAPFGEEGSGVPAWKHGNCKGAFSTQELMTISPGTLTSGMVQAAKESFGAKITNYSQDDILHRYPESDSRIVWKGPSKDLGRAWREKYSEDLATLAPAAKCDCDEYRAVEFSGGRVAVLWKRRSVGSDDAEIREGVE